MTSPSVEQVRDLGVAILRDLGPEAPHWTVLDVTLQRDSESAYCTVTIGAVSTPHDAVVALFPLHLPTAEATVVFATHIQDHALEQAAGKALPPCTAHPNTHPMTPAIEDGTPVWKCEQSPVRFAIGAAGLPT